jgi:hypothetical protein
MPTNTHDCHQPWLENEKVRMVITGFLTVAEYPLLEFYSGTREYHFLLLNFSH